MPSCWCERGFGGRRRVSALPKALTSEGLAIRNRRAINVLVWTHLKFVGCYHNSHSSTFSLTGRSSKARTYQAPGLRPSRSCAFFLIALGSIAFDPIYSEMSPTSSLWLYLEPLPAALNGKSNSTIHLNVVGALKARDLPNALSRQRFVSSLRGP